MNLTKKQIKELKKELAKGEKAIRAMAEQSITALIEEFTGVEGHVDHLTGDGLGFMPKANEDRLCKTNSYIFGLFD